MFYVGESVTLRNILGTSGMTLVFMVEKIHRGVLLHDTGFNTGKFYSIHFMPFGIDTNFHILISCTW
jgi:hypothetical protein